jgi:hypothetical protein
MIFIELKDAHVVVLETKSEYNFILHPVRHELKVRFDKFTTYLKTDWQCYSCSKRMCCIVTRYL